MHGSGVSGAEPTIRRLGVLGGTFDPPHYAHLALAENSRVQLELDLVLFVPAGHPPHKLVEPPSPVHKRVAMVEAAIADNPAFILSRVDVERPGPHFTVRTLSLIHDEYPQAELFFIIGEDSLAEFHKWRDPAGIVRLARLAVMRRPGWQADVERLEQGVPEVCGRVSWLDVPLLDISSTELRRRVRQGLPIRYLVPPSVDACVHTHRLYRGDAG
ncbi:MAG: nicotinate-nucleotide adenylyltransferase [Anaerolineales bacterium]|nr:nicotinate-nucleotide adenylyltransferase [Anaerolineales bacterium]